MHADEGPFALEPLAVELEGELSCLEALVRIAHGLPRAAVPEHDGAPPVLAHGDRAFKLAVLDRVVLDLDGEALVGGVEARTLGHGPALEHAVELEAKVVVQR